MKENSMWCLGCFLEFDSQKVHTPHHIDFSSDCILLKPASNRSIVRPPRIELIT